MIMRRRPLLRAAAVGGGAYVAGKRTAARRVEQEQAYAERDARIGQLEQQQVAPPSAGTAAGPAPASLSDQLNQLMSLRNQGMLTDEEFSAAKAKLLGI
jgi:hypothetical protein